MHFHMGLWHIAELCEFDIWKSSLSNRYKCLMKRFSMHVCTNGLMKQCNKFKQFVLSSHFFNNV